jgi:hypothetical protein
MNCLDFRRRWLTVPNARDLVLTQHERACAPCRQFARRGSVFESRLREALAIEIPAGLTERIRQRRDIGEQVRARQLRPLRYTLAVGLLLLTGLASLLSYEFLATNLQAAELKRTVMRHIAAEQRHLLALGETPRARVERLFARFGAQLKGDLGHVHFAEACRQRGFDGVHLVLQGRAGPVTVLYLDGEYIDDVARIDDDQHDGILVPVERGSVAVVGEPGEGVEAVAKLLRGNLRWRI